jgi:hypothetical protein
MNLFGSLFGNLYDFFIRFVSNMKVENALLIAVVTAACYLWFARRQSAGQTARMEKIEEKHADLVELVRTSIGSVTRAHDIHVLDAEKMIGEQAEARNRLAKENDLAHALMGERLAALEAQTMDTRSQINKVLASGEAVERRIDRLLEQEAKYWPAVMHELGCLASKVADVSEVMRADNEATVHKVESLLAAWRASTTSTRRRKA